MATPNITGKMLSAWHVRLMHADHKKITKVAQSSAVRGLPIIVARFKNNCSPPFEGAVTNAPTRSPTTLDIRHIWNGTLLHIDVPKMNAASIC